MQKNVPRYTPEWVPTIKQWAETSKREVAYAVCNDRRTLIWFANQRAVEYHPSLMLGDGAGGLYVGELMDPARHTGLAAQRARDFANKLRDLNGGNTGVATFLTEMGIEA